MDGWMVDFRWLILRPLQNTTVITGRLADDVCMKKINSSAGLEPRTARSIGKRLIY